MMRRARSCGHVHLPYLGWDPVITGKFVDISGCNKGYAGICRSTQGGEGGGVGSLLYK
jgi:hypothetical protein